MKRRRPQYHEDLKESCKCSPDFCEGHCAKSILSAAASNKVGDDRCVAVLRITQVCLGMKTWTRSATRRSAVVRLELDSSHQSSPIQDISSHHAIVFICNVLGSAPELPCQIRPSLQPKTEKPSFAQTKEPETELGTGVIAAEMLVLLVI